MCIAAAAASVAQVPDKHAGQGRPGMPAAPAFPRHLLADAGSCPLPAWPREALLYDLQGSSTVSFAIAADGTVEQARLLRSSGWQVLDQAALRGIGACRFKPGLAAAERAGPYPMQFAWKLEGAPGVAPVLRDGSCPAAGRFARFVPFATASAAASARASGTASATASAKASASASGAISAAGPDAASGTAGAGGVRVRFLVGEGGAPTRLAAEADGQPAALIAGALDFVRACRFDYDASIPGERSSSVSGRVLVQ